MWGGTMTALWVIAAVVLLALIVYVWNKNCTEKAEIAAGVQKLVGRVDALEPAVTAQGNNIYTLNGVMASTVQGVKDLKQCFGDDRDGLVVDVTQHLTHTVGNALCVGDVDVSTADGTLNNDESPVLHLE